DAAALETAKSQVVRAGGELLSDIYDGEPGIDRALRLRSPEGHVFKLFCGMQTDQVLEPGDRPIKFEHVSVKVRNKPRFERFPQGRPRLSLLGPHLSSGELVALRRRSPRHGRRLRAEGRAVALRLRLGGPQRAR